MYFIITVKCSHIFHHIACVFLFLANSEKDKFSSNEIYDNKEYRLYIVSGVKASSIYSFTLTLACFSINDAVTGQHMMRVVVVPRTKQRAARAALSYLHTRGVSSATCPALS